MKDTLSKAKVQSIIKRLSHDSEEMYLAKKFCYNVRLDGDMPDQSNPHYAGLGRCWRWKWITKEYPIIYTERKRGKMAYRVSYTIFKGEIPKGMCVMHRCDNKQCTNPDHLELGTNVQNIQDAHKRGLVEKGRMRMKKGVQSVYAMCKVHNHLISLEREAHEAQDFFKSNSWKEFKKQVDDSLLSIVFIHSPDMVENLLQFRIRRILRSADKDACDKLLKSDPHKIRILHPRTFDPQIHNQNVYYSGF